MLVTLSLDENVGLEMSHKVNGESDAQFVVFSQPVGCFDAQLELADALQPQGCVGD